MKYEDKLKMNTCCIIANTHLADIITDIIDVAQSGVLPDGDHIDTSTILWLEGLINKFYDLAEKRKYSKARVKNG